MRIVSTTAHEDVFEKYEYYRYEIRLLPGGGQETAEIFCAI